MILKGFWSYAQGDDEHLEGLLSDLRKKVAGELSMLLGYDVDIFQDISDLRTGDRWEERLRAEVTAATFLVPLLTPRYFNRPFCREETLTFLRVARDQGVVPRIFPIRFVDFNVEEGDEVRAALAEFQYKDFSYWRYESDPTRRAAMLNGFAKDVTERLNTATPILRPAEPDMIVPALAHPSPPVAQSAPAQSQLPTLTVDPVPGQANFSSISAAIDAAPPGSRIVVRQGTYREALRLSKPLVLVGEGSREGIVVTSAAGEPLHCDAPLARVAGMTFRREAGGMNCGVWITGGSVEMENCIIESQSLSCVEVRGNAATPTLRQCLIRNGASAGLNVLRGARPIVEDCEFSGNALTGVWVEGAGTYPTLRRCVVRGGSFSFRDGAGGLLEQCEAIDSPKAGMDAAGNGTVPTFRSCKVRNGKSSGFGFADGAVAVLEACESFGNELSGVQILTGADPILRSCWLVGNRQAGALVATGGRGRLEGCNIEWNYRDGIAVCTGGSPTVTGCTINHNVGAAVMAASGGIFIENDLRYNSKGAWSVHEGGHTLTRRNNQGG